MTGVEVLANGELILRRSGPVLEIQFNRPTRLNSFTHAMYEGLRSICDDLMGDASARVLLLRGVGGRAFAAGTDIADFSNFDGAAGVAYETGIRTVLDGLIRLPQVTVAAVDGVCIGGGLAVASYCDLRICTEGSRFGYPVARTVGNMLSASVLYRCVSVFGEALTREMLLASRLVDAERAQAVGAVMSVVAPDAFDDAVDEVVRGVQLASPETLRATKEQLLAYVDRHEASPADDDARIARVYDSPDLREGVRAFLAREKPRFSTGP